MPARVRVLGVEVDALDRAQILTRLRTAVADHRGHHHLSVNASKLVRAARDPTLRRVATDADTVAADGMSVVWAARGSLPERVAGCDLMHDLLDEAVERCWSVALLGARPDVVAEVARRLTARGVAVVYARNGYVPADAEREVAAGVGAHRPDLCLVAMGSPRAEHFIARWGTALDAGVILGVGGGFDVLAGRVRRAPAHWQAAGLEWVWRVARAPRQRFRRGVVDSARFVLRVLVEPAEAAGDP